jgi:hypothetical protein
LADTWLAASVDVVDWTLLSAFVECLLMRLY